MTRLFRHCFPIAQSRFTRNRQRAPFDTQAQADLALSQLESIFHFGLLLTPEEQKFRGHEFRISAGQMEKVSHQAPNTQVRCCFTFGDISALQNICAEEDIGFNHLDVFGDFWIGLGEKAARSLGMMPVHYYHPGETDTRDEMKASDLGAAMPQFLLKMRDIMYSLLLLDEGSDAIADINFSDWQPNWDRRFCSDTATAIRAISELFASDDRVIEKLLPFDHLRPRDAIGHINLLLSLFQTVGSEKLGQNMVYYDQSEWRIVDIERAGMEFLSIDQQQPDGWEEIRQRFVASLRRCGIVRIDQKKLLLGVHQGGMFRKFGQLVEEVGCPRHSEAVVRATLADFSHLRIIVH